MPIMSFLFCIPNYLRERPQDDKLRKTYLSPLMTSYFTLKILQSLDMLAYSHEDRGIVEGRENLLDERCEVQSAKISPLGMLGWLTGQRNWQLDGEKLLISVKFDHECIQ